MMGGGATNDGIRCPSLDVVGDRPSVNVAFYGAIFTMRGEAVSEQVGDVVEAGSFVPASYCKGQNGHRQHRWRAKGLCQNLRGEHPQIRHQKFLRLRVQVVRAGGAMAVIHRSVRPSVCYV